MNSSRDHALVESSLEDSVSAVTGLDVDRLLDVAKTIVRCYRKGGKVMLCGNGGSASQAQHLAAELVCKFRRNRAPFSAIALTTDTSILTAQANDATFSTVFERQVDAHGRKGDVLLALSTSGNSLNVVNALKAAKRKSVVTVVFTGNNRTCKVAKLADHVLFVNCRDTPRIQEAHLVAGHIVCDLVETEFATEK